ncbi:MAG TPA: hypothetical protein PL030_09655 [Smithella sp.]|nr:hypothetical protein [Smithella sp.]
MNSGPPEYFINIQNDARQRWNQLDADPVLAGPWHQLFRQVQSPRHVLSELLQNADDAKASWIRATIKNDVFEFIHDGEDFDADALQSLCQFGLSNKRHLHTIGFRGVGFKSVFSLGPQVAILTPTLSFGFNKKRFTEPFWIDTSSFSRDETVIKVKIEDHRKAAAIKTEIEHWVKSPIPLLFFNNIRKLEIQQDTINKEILGAGPVRNASYVRLSGRETIDVTVINSEPALFPMDALQEIRDERGSTELELPPSIVQIILCKAKEHHLYTVLPTDVTPYLPFSLNGPFIQDPARKEIKHPATSPTNQWLLQRIGALAANTMIAWLENRDLGVEERIRAYDLLPAISKDSNGLNQACTECVLEELRKHIKTNSNILLTQDNTLSSKEKTIMLPKAITKTWTVEQSLSIFSPKKQKLLAQNISDQSLKALKSWDFVDELEAKDMIERLMNSKPICPEPVEKLIHIWAHLQPFSTVDHTDLRKLLRNLSIVPVSGKSALLPASQVMVLGTTTWNVSNENKDFLISQVDIVDASWVNFMAKQDDDNNNRDLELARDLFMKLSLHQRVGVEQVVTAVAKKIFSSQNIAHEHGIRLAQVAALSDVRIQDDFKYLCRDGCWRKPNADLLIQGINDLESILPTDIFSKKVISSDYAEGLSRKDIEQWNAWVNAFEKSKLLGFPMPALKEINLYKTHAEISAYCVEKGGHAPSEFPLKSQTFHLVDYDWEDEIWDEWKDMTDNDPEFIKSVLLAIFNNWSDFWDKRIEAKINQEGHSYYRLLNHGKLHAAWLQKFRNLPCLPDTFGHCYLPIELYRRTADTDALYNVEKFIHPDFDKPQYSKILDLLGVRNKPTGVDALLARLKDLSNAGSPPITHLVYLYRAIDRVLLRMDQSETRNLKVQFNTAALIYTDVQDWEKLINVYRDNPDNIPGVRLIHPEAVNLAMWDRMEVRRQPTLEMAIHWLKTKPLGDALNKADRDRAIQIIRRAPRQVWDTCKAWLDATGRWVAKEDFRWYTSNSKILSTLFSNFKKQTTDVSIFDGDSYDFLLDAGIKDLDSLIEYRLVNLSSDLPAEKPAWLEKLSDILLRLRRDDGGELSGTVKSFYKSERQLADRLKQLKWQQVRYLKITPYISGEQAGTPVNSKVILQGNTLYVQGSPPAHHRELVEELSRQIQRPEIRKIIADCVDRDSAWIDAYAMENLDLLEKAPDLPGEQEPVKKAPVVTETPVSADAEIEITGLQETAEDQNDQKEDEDNDDEEENELKKQPYIRKRDDHVKKGFESYLQSKGFVWSPEHEHFKSDDGSVIKKAEGVFHWLEYNVLGERVGSYWVGHGAMEKGIEIPADIWNQMPDEHQKIHIAIVNDKKVNIYPLVQLKEMARKAQIEVYPIRYTIRVRTA